MSAGIYRLEVTMTAAERERIRRACIEEGLLEEDELLDLEDYRLFTA
jgi:hypothetical protein